MTTAAKRSLAAPDKRKISRKTTAMRSRKPKKANQHPEAVTKWQGQAKELTGTVCCLCGEHIPAGKLLVHKEQRHGERMVTPSPGYRNINTWVRVVQGGLPGLGRRH